MITRQNVSCLESQFAQETRWMTIGDLYNAYKVLSFLSIYYKRYELWAKYANELNLGWSIQNWVITPLSFHLLVFEMHPTVSPENRIDRKRRNHIQATLKEVNKSKFCAAVLMLLFDLNFSYIQCIPFPICTFFCPDMVKWSNNGITDTYAVLGLLNQELPFRTPLFRGHFPWSQGCPLQRCSNVFCLCFSLVTSNLII